MRSRITFGLLAVATGLLLAVAPVAQAHATYETDDGKYLIIWGNQAEPAVTYQVNGLDLIIRTNTDDPQDVPGVNATLEATLIAPGGEELSLPLENQYGEEGRYEFTQPFTLTQPGLYKLQLKGDIEGSPVDGVYDGKHTIPPQSELMFPDEGLPTLADLQEENEQLRAEIAALEERMTMMETHMDAMMAGTIDDGDSTDDGMEESNGAPALPLTMLLVALGLAGNLRRRFGQE